MKIRFVKLGKISSKEINLLVESYQKRLKGFCKFEVLEFKANKKTPAEIIGELKQNSSDYIVLLDERGSELSSPELADFIQQKSDHREIKSLAFVVGSPYGLGPEARAKADFIWSLSKGVFPNEIAWLLLWEQVYRAFNIIQGTPYHHE